MRPTILLTPNPIDGGRIAINSAYCHAIEAAGGVPIIMPLYGNGDLIKSALDKADGLLLTGGGDVSPDFYGEPNGFGDCTDVSVLRDRTEMMALWLAEHRDLPVFGICRGIQIMNVAFGGTLLRNVDGHMQTEARAVTTEYIEVSEPLCDILGEKCKVNSFHHQAVDRAAHGFSVCARGKDGVIEAIAMSGKKFFIGVQWHPEHMTNGEPGAAGLFRKFIDVCRDGMKK